MNCVNCEHEIKFDVQCQDFKHYEKESKKIRSVCVYCGCLWAKKTKEDF